MRLRFASGRPFLFSGVCSVSLIALLGACANDFDTTRSPPPRGTVGQELYSVLCDRVGAQALNEDLNGASFHALCHADAQGAFADKVDVSRLPPIVEGAADREGNVISVEQQTFTRNHAIARIEALAHRRADLIAALDATFPEQKVPVKDIGNGDPKRTCDAPSGSAPGERRLADELADMLGRFTELYDDGTIPQSTESLAKIFDGIKASPDAQAALSRFEARQGYRPIQLALGAARPIVAYPNLRDLTNAALALLSADAKPYDPNAPKDDRGERVPVAGPANAQLQKLVEVGHNELVYANPDPTPIDAPEKGRDPANGRPLLTRPRTNLEMLEAIAYKEIPELPAAAPHFIVRRDPRGYADVRRADGSVPAPFVLDPKTRLAAVDDLGRFRTTNGQPPASPFFAVGQPAGMARDACGRALLNGGAPAAGDAGASSSACGNVTDDQLMYGYIDTSHVFAASLLNDLRPLTDPDPAKKHETLMYALAGANALFGTRDGTEATQKCYQPGANGTCADPASTLAYDAFHPENAAALDLVYALGQVLGDATSDDTLSYVQQLFTSHQPELARLTGDALVMRDMANAHPEAKIPAKSVLWDDMLDTAVKLEKEPGLLEDLLRALGTDPAQNLGQIFANYMTFRDEITYDPADLNGKPLNKTTNTPGGDMKTPVDRTKPDTGFNRSALQRFLQLIHDTNGVAACNKDGAVVHANLAGIPLTYPLIGTAKECEIFKIDNLAAFYVDAIAGTAELKLRPGLLSAAASTKVMEDSSGITGFWPGGGIHPMPKWLNRLVFFDQKNDTHAPTQKFLADLNGPVIGTSICKERVIADPVNDAQTSPDKMVHGLRSCDPGQSLQERGAGTIFVWEQFGFYDAIKPLVLAFVNHKREDLFIELMETLHRHWADDKGTAAECTISGGRTCSKDGVVTYEPLVAQMMATDIFPALHDFEKTLETTSVPHCDTLNPDHTCSGTPTNVTGLTLLGNATRALLDPDKAKAIGLKDRKGSVLGLRNDGTTNPQVTPMYLLTEALNAADAAFGSDADRLAQWRLARSQLVDQFLAVDGAGTKTASFHNVAIPKIVPQVLDLTRAQLFQHCPTSFAPPYDRCTWARDDLTSKLSDVVKGPLFASTMDLLEAVRKDEPSRRQIGLLMQYLLDGASKNDALPAALASVNDLLQVLKDDTNLVPLYHVLGQSLDKTETDAKGHITKKSLIDAQLALLARMSGRAFDADGTEICSKELDPNQVLTFALGNLVTPMQGANGQPGQTPLEVIMDVVGDVNRAAPERADKLDATDYASIADNVSDFLLNKERGLEQFYEIVRQGTRGE